MKTFRKDFFSSCITDAKKCARGAQQDRATSMSEREWGIENRYAQHVAQNLQRIRTCPNSLGLLSPRERLKGATAVRKDDTDCGIYTDGEALGQQASKHHLPYLQQIVGESVMGRPWGKTTPTCCSPGHLRSPTPINIAPSYLAAPVPGAGKPAVHAAAGVVVVVPSRSVKPSHAKQSETVQTIVSVVLRMGILLLGSKQFPCHTTKSIHVGKRG